MLMREWSLSVKTKPVTEPVRTDEFKKWLRIEGPGQDDVMVWALSGARQVVEDMTGQTMVNTTYQMRFDTWPCDSVIELPRGPLVTLDSVKYTDAAGAQQTVLPADYVADGNYVPTRVFPAYSKTWPSNRGFKNDIVVEFTAGYGTSGAAVPQQLKMGLMFLASVYYSTRVYEINEANWLALQRMVGPFLTRQLAF